MAGAESDSDSSSSESSGEKKRREAVLSCVVTSDDVKQACDAVRKARSDKQGQGDLVEFEKYSHQRLCSLLEQTLDHDIEQGVWDSSISRIESTQDSKLRLFSKSSHVHMHDQAPIIINALLDNKRKKSKGGEHGPNDNGGKSKDDERKSKDDKRKSKDDRRKSKDDKRKSKDDKRKSKDDKRKSKHRSRETKDGHKKGPKIIAKAKVKLK